MRMRFLLISLLGLLTLPTADAKEDTFKQEKARYRAYLERPSLRMRQRGREKFAKTNDIRALEILAKSYSKPEKPKDAVRYLIASTCANQFEGKEAFEIFAEWRRKNMKPRDAWLWYRTIAAELAHDADTQTYPAAERILETKSGYLRMAALEAYARSRRPELLETYAKFLRTWTGPGFEQELLLRSAADVLVRTSKQKGTQPWRDIARMLSGNVEARRISPATQLVLERRLTEVFGFVPTLKSLQGLLDDKPVSRPTTETSELAEFLGMRATGSRIGYVIDLSDSMLEPVTVKELKDLAKLTELPWDQITSRFDAARELIRASLETLTPKQSFFVVTFGSEAKMLACTPGLRAATPGLKAKVMRELENIEIGPPKKGRPHGTLGGYTNLHGGLHRAFEVKGKSRVKTGEYIDPEIFGKGCDSIFLLSDGKPTWDDHPMKDTLEPEDDPGDPESGWKATESKTATFYGPYTLTRWLRDDLTRMNLFRRVEIHCVGLGEYDPHLLSWLARLGHGSLRRIGDGPKKKGKKK